MTYKSQKFSVSAYNISVLFVGSKDIVVYGLLAFLHKDLRALLNHHRLFLCKKHTEERLYAIK